MIDLEEVDLVFRQGHDDKTRILEVPGKQRINKTIQKINATLNTDSSEEEKEERERKSLIVERSGSLLVSSR